jgi:hypothetical protein
MNETSTCKKGDVSDAEKREACLTTMQAALTIILEKEIVPNSENLPLPIRLSCNL